MLTRHRVLSMCLAGFAAVAAGGAGAQDALKPQKGGTAVIAVSSEPSGLNGVVSTASPVILASCMINEGLVDITSDNKVKPALAESWTISPDGKTYTFKLRKAKWHDGTAFTAEDVRYTMAEVAAKLHPTFSAQIGKLLESVTTPDEQTVVVKLSKPYGPFLHSLSCSLSGGILQAKAFKGTDVLTNPATTSTGMGTGPFKFVKWERGSAITLTRNDDYWDTGKPYLNGLVIRFMGTPASRAQALLAGEVDYVSASQVAYSDQVRIGQNPKFQLQATGWPPSMMWGFFNVKKKPFDDVKVRQALLAATDRKYITDNAFSGIGTVATAPWTTQIPWSTDPALSYDKTYPFDPEKAGQALEQAGYKADASGVRIRMGISYNSASAEENLAATALQGMWRRAGVEVALQPVEQAVLLPRVHKDLNFDFYITQYTSYGDPAIGIARGFISETIGRNFGNAAGYSNPEVDALFEKAVEPSTLEERGAIYRQVQNILMRDTPLITLHDMRGKDVATKKLHGVWTTFGFGQWGDAWMDQ